MPNNFEIKGFLTSFKQEVIDMMLAEEQEINALELIAKANEKKGTEIGKILARHEDGMSVVEIANKMDISEQKVKEVLTEAGLLK